MTRLAIAVCCYAAIFAVSFCCALALRFDIDPLQFLYFAAGNPIPIPAGTAGRGLFELEQQQFAVDTFRSGLGTLVLLKVAVVLFSRDWRRHLRYSTMRDLAWSGGVCLICGVLLAASQLARETMPEVPRGVIVLDTILSAALLSAARILAQMLRTLKNMRRNPHSRRALIYARGADAAGLLSSIQSGASALRVVGIVVPSRHMPLGLLGGVETFDGSGDLQTIIAQTRAEMVLLGSKLSGRTIREVSEVCRQSGVEAHVVPSVEEIPAGRFQLRLREITIDDLLRREPNQLNLDEIRDSLVGRVVLVTGAAGSIGSEVCRQLLNFGPARIVMLDQSEFGIFQLEQEFLQLRRSSGAGLPTLEFLIEDITDEIALQRVFMAHRPAVVFHAAAYKHVPLMESNPQAAVRNNVFGTQVLVDLADRFSVQRFVMISTDKAVRPTNIMGATKLIAEEYLFAVASRSKTRFITVRFGNVLNSAGSVVPTFRRQIEQGGPVTVTDPEMERYFMTIPEAVQLVLQSGAIGAGGDVLILDMGEPVRIVDLAKDMIRLSGQRYPEDIDIVFTGLRPGEKLFEELFYETEQNAVRIHDKIFRAPRERGNSEDVVQRELRLLQQHLSSGREELREVLWQVAGRVVQHSSGQTGDNERTAA
ncbi:MAG TPA: polysaccharide biosynthesis protein [Planctomycetaceae bacterium]|nr:polysaccharide biosynthesis protein [Planctomycetaceae bacterium]